MADAAVAPLSRPVVGRAPRAPRIRRLWNVGAVGVLVCIAALHVWSLLRFPPPFVDEAWIASRGWALVTRGEMVGSLDKGIVDRVPHGWAVFPVLPTLAHAAALAIAGAPSVLAVRLVSLLGGATLALAIWSIARRVSDARTALLAVMLLTLSRSFAYSSHLARADVIAAAMGYGGVALYVSGQRHRAWLAALGGLSASLALDMHPFAVVIVASLLVLAVAEFGIRLATRAIPRALLAGLATGAGSWMVIHLCPGVHTYTLLTNVFFGPRSPPTSVWAWFTGAGDLLALLLGAFGWALPVALWAVVSLASSRNSTARGPAILVATVFVGFAILINDKLFYYAILITPGLTLCMALALTRTIDHARIRPSISRAWLTVCAVLIVQSSTLVLGELAFNSYPVYERVQERIASRIRPAETIMGSQTYWFGLHEHEYYSWEQLVFLRRLRPGSSVVDALSTLRPDVLIRDGQMDQYLTDSRGPTRYNTALRVPRAELESWLNVNARIVDDFDGERYGRVRVYRLEWPD